MFLSTCYIAAVCWVQGMKQQIRQKDRWTDRKKERGRKEGRKKLNFDKYCEGNKEITEIDISWGRSQPL